MKESDLNLYWNQFRNELLNFIRKKISIQPDAEDILQDVFIKMYKNYDQLNNQSKLKAWLYQITNHAIVDYYRKQEDPQIPYETVEHLLVNEESHSNMNDEIVSCLKLFLTELPEHYRIPLEMHELEGKKHKEISQELNISLSGSKTRILRGREKLREILTNCCEIEFDAYGNVVEVTQLKSTSIKCEK